MGQERFNIGAQILQTFEKNGFMITRTFTG